MFSPGRRGATSIYRALRTNSGTSVRSIQLSTRVTWTTPTKSTNLLRPVGLRYLHFTSSLRNSASAQIETADELELLGKEHGPITKFDELAERGLVDPVIIDEITKGMGHHTLTQVQSLTIDEALKGTDMVAQARTGTGKTIGFLLPVIQRILNDDPSLKQRSTRYSRDRAQNIRGIIISPTRELAQQIAAEAVTLVRNTGIKVQVAVGGNSRRSMLERTTREGCHLLIATPGRLLDLLTDEYSGVAAPKLQSLVLDEADRLLDIGFADEIREIIRQLPDRSEVDRQTLLFSATMPEKVLNLVEDTLKEKYTFVQTVHQGEQQTHEKVPQKIVEARGFENIMPTLFELCKKHTSEALDPTQTKQPFKAIVFFSSTVGLQLASSIFNNLRDPENTRQHLLSSTRVIEMHSQLSQREREEASGSFRRAKSAILFSTDVTARGMDFPGVTHVIQVGLPPDAEQYVHRIGRTGRGANAGEGYIIVTSFEMQQARRILGRFPITRDTTLETPSIDMTKEAKLSTETATILTQIGDATKSVDARLKSKAYTTALSYISRITGKTGRQSGVDALNQWSRYGWGWEVPPRVKPRIAANLGLSSVRGLNFSEDTARSDDWSRGFGDESRDDDRRGGSGFGRPARSFGDRGRSFGDREDSFGSRRNSFGGERDSFGGRRDSSDSFGNRNNSFGGRNNTFGGRNNSFGGRTGSSRPRRDTWESNWGGDSGEDNSRGASF